MTQQQMVINYLKRFKSITARDAVYDLGIIDLAGVIRNLRDSGIKIKDRWEIGVNRWGDECRYKRYYR